MRFRALFVSVALVLVASRAEAYRPFDGTDADVAEYGEFELEMGPAHLYSLGRQNYVIAPATVLNFGVFRDTELVIDFKDFVALGHVDGPRAQLLDTDVLLKHVFRHGILQGKTGLSIAAEGGPLTPEINGSHGFGATLDVIASYQWQWTTLHFNEQAQLSREHNLDLFSGVIVEGPHTWKVRPVAEFFYEREYTVTETRSVLVGAIWTLDESFVLDLGVRGALIGNQPARELRLGFTWAFPLWGKAENAAEAGNARTSHPLRRSWL